MEYYYETHLHTTEGSKCARKSAEEQVKLYKELGYTGICITDHYFNGNTTVPRDLPWEERVDLYCRAYENGREAGDKVGLDVFFGFEYTLGNGTDFLVYGIDKQWLLDHPDHLDWEVRRFFRTVRADGGIVIHAHPFREAGYIDMIRLLPREIDGVEAPNANRTDFENALAVQFAENYGLPLSAGSDNHVGKQGKLAGIVSEKRFDNVKALILSVLGGESKTFMRDMEK